MCIAPGRCPHQSIPSITLNRPCTCILCGKTIITKHGVREILMSNCENESEPTSCIRIAHYIEAQWTHPANFTPKWKKISAYPECNIAERQVNLTIICMPHAVSELF